MLVRANKRGFSLLLFCIDGGFLVIVGVCCRCRIGVLFFPDITMVSISFAFAAAAAVAHHCFTVIFFMSFAIVVLLLMLDTTASSGLGFCVVAAAVAVAHHFFTVVHIHWRFVIAVLLLMLDTTGQRHRIIHSIQNFGQRHWCAFKTALLRCSVTRVCVCVGW